MEVKVAKTAGFCFGVKRAVDMALACAGEDTPVYTLGDIIHNETVVGELKEKGIMPIYELSEFKDLPKGKVIIRSHGVTRAAEKELKDLGFEIVDATCPFVKKIHNLVDEHSKDPANKILIIGDKDHPEVQGICGWCNSDPIIIANEQEALDYSKNKGLKHIIVTQTTFNLTKMKGIVEILEKKSYDIIVLNTICNATELRQAEAEELAGQVDCMIVIGGKNSSNTQKLYDICIKKCVDTYYIQTLVDLDLTRLRSFRCVGITAGASTTNNIIEEVQKHVRNEF